MRGRDIKRYSYEFADLYLLFVPWHFPLHNDPTITGVSEKAETAFKQDYPAIYNHLLQYKKQLENRNKAETGIRYEWYALQRWGANYWEDFYKQKIVWKAVGKNLSFSILEEGSFLTAPASFITSSQNLFLLGFLCSNYAKYYIYNNSDTTGAGDIMLNIQSLEKLPIPKNFLYKETIENNVKKIMENIEFNKQINLIENEINDLIYKEFGFNINEIKFIENL